MKNYSESERIPFVSCFVSLDKHNIDASVKTVTSNHTPKFSGK